MRWINVAGLLPFSYTMVRYQCPVSTIIWFNGVCYHCNPRNRWLKWYDVATNVAIGSYFTYWYGMHIYGIIGTLTYGYITRYPIHCPTLEAIVHSGLVQFMGWMTMCLMYDYDVFVC